MERRQRQQVMQENGQALPPLEAKEYGYPIDELFRRWSRRTEVAVKDGSAERRWRALYERYSFVTHRREGMTIYAPQGMFTHVIDQMPEVRTAVRNKTHTDDVELPQTHIILLPERSFLDPQCEGATNAYGNHMIMDMSGENPLELFAHEDTHAEFAQKHGWSQSRALREGVAMYGPHMMYPSSRYSDFRKKEFGYDDVVKVAIDDAVIGLSETELLQQVNKDPNAPFQLSHEYGYGGAMVALLAKKYGGWDTIHEMYRLSCFADRYAYGVKQREINAYLLRQVGIDPQRFAANLDAFVHEEVQTRQKPKRKWFR